MPIRTLFAALVVTLGALACGGEFDENGLTANVEAPQEEAAAPAADEELGTSEDPLLMCIPGMPTAPKSKTVQLSTGVTMHYIVQGNPFGKPVIFIPGYSDSWQTWSLNAPLFNPNWRVYMIDQRGHGDSSKPTCCYTQNDFAADLVAFMNAMNIQKAALVGHSMGSFTAHQVAAFHPNRVSHLVLIGSAKTAVGHVPGEELRDFVNTLPFIDRDFVDYFQRGTFFKPVPETYMEGMIASSLKVPLSVWQQSMAGLVSQDHTHQLKKIKAKTLILFGDQDSLFNLQHQNDLKAAIPGSKLKVYRNVGHGVHAEIPLQFNAELVQFIK